MTGAAYSTEADFSLSNNPEIAPEVVETAIKLQYHKNLIGRKLLGYKSLVTSTTSTIEEGDTEGDVNWLSENGGLPKLDFTFLKGTRKVRPYGGYFEVSEEQQMDGLTDEIRMMINNVAYTITYFEDLVIFNDIINATGLNSVSAQNPWDNKTTGDPIKDLGTMRSAISQATKGQKPNTLIISEKTFNYLTAFDAIRSRLYNSQGGEGYVVTAQVPTLMGMAVIIDDAVDPNDAGQALAIRQKDIGTWEERFGLTTRSIPGYVYGKDQIAFKYTAKAKGEPNIKYPKLGCLIDSLYTA